MTEPVTTVYREPRERVLFWKERDANPFFHLMEALWMLGGRNDVAYPAQFARQIKAYSDDGETLHGAYGYRWRHQFHTGNDHDSPGLHIDQLLTIAHLLKEDPDDRRAVLQMWDCAVDLGRGGKDVPCNTHVYFTRDAEGSLDMTVLCRSNDIVWGCYGANAVHFSMLQEFIAAAIGCAVGRYWQVSNNFHAYQDTYEQVLPLTQVALTGWEHTKEIPCPYSTGQVEPFPLVSIPAEDWLQELKVFLDEGPVTGFQDPFFKRVAGPMFLAHKAHREKNGEGAMEELKRCAAKDWKLAGIEWLERRAAGRARAEDDGVVYE